MPTCQLQRYEDSQNSGLEPIQSQQDGSSLRARGGYDDWREKLLSDVAAATKEVETNANIKVMDVHLARLMEAKHSIKINGKRTS
ncbi:hypothetical protein HPB50_020485 [Hyalomma asiaticum]|uniref:Uncharacterized protein n=1 Tax=Hyalomma asiaticum TaxID=266040 RepID=A0ACB7T5M8_HYAAI|nr:hypothetical protein HPB50_020485 [Hyalomma asiaticum]